MKQPRKEPFQPVALACEVVKLLAEPDGGRNQRLKKGETELARLLNVTPGTVNHWLWQRRPVPVIQCVRIESITHGVVSRKMLRPDDWSSIWPDLLAGSE